MVNSRTYWHWATFALVVFVLTYSLIFKPEFLPELVFISSSYVLLYLYDRKFKLSTPAYILFVCIPLVHMLGVLGFYAIFIVGNLGYDKFVHFFGSFAALYGVSEIFPKKMKFRYIFLILVVLGAGSIVEANEFIGYRYFGVDNGGIFTMGDQLPEIKSDLQTFDTYFDIIFNTLGAITAVGVLEIKKSLVFSR